MNSDSTELWAIVRWVLLSLLRQAPPQSIVAPDVVFRLHLQTTQFALEYTSNTSVHSCHANLEIARGRPVSYLANRFSLFQASTVGGLMQRQSSLKANWISALCCAI